MLSPRSALSSRPGGRGPEAGGKSDLLWMTIAAPRADRVEQLLVGLAPRPTAIEDQQHQVGGGQGLAGACDAGLLDGAAGRVQAGRVAQFHGPAVDGGREGDDIARGAGRVVYDRPLVTGQGVHQAALAHVRPPGQHHAPRLREMQSQRRAGQ